MPALPPELIRHIVSEVERVRLPTLCGVSRLFQFEAERLIHRKIVWILRKEIVVESKRLLRKPRIWPHIRELEIGNSYTSLEMTANFVNLLASLLRNVPALVSLTILLRGPFGRRWATCGAIFGGSSFQLQYLCCTFTLDHKFSAFLLTQPSIVHFRWEVQEPPSLELLSPAVLPNLSILFIWSFNPFLSCTRIVSGRPITHLTCYPPNNPSTLEDIALSTASLTGLDLHYLSLPAPWELLVQLFPGLEYLSLVELDDFNARRLINLFWITPLLIEFIRIP
jgi:hypothetical protein